MHYLKNIFSLLCTWEEKVFSCEKVNHHFGYLQLFLKSPLIPLSAEGNPYPVSQLQCPRHVSLLGMLPKELLLEGLRRGMAGLTQVLTWRKGRNSRGVTDAPLFCEQTGNKIRLHPCKVVFRFFLAS